MVQEKGVGKAHRTWVVQQDEEALAGSEAVLQAVRGEALDATKPQEFQTWEEVDGQVVVFVPDNLLVAGIKIVQRQGDLLALQVHWPHLFNMRTIQDLHVCWARQEVCSK